MEELKKIRVNTDVTMSVSIVDNGVAIHTDNLSDVYVGLYSENQKALVSRCAYTPAGDKLIIKSIAANQRFEGPHRLVLSCTMGERKATYDAMAFEIVRWSGDVLPPQDLEEASEPIGIRIEFSEISSSLVHELLAATIAATDAANTATENAVNVTELANDAADKATTQASAAEEGAIRANAAAQLAETNAVQASNATEKAVTATTNAESATADAVQAAEAARLATTNATEAAVSANAGASSANEAASAARAATENAVVATGEAQQASEAANAAADRANEASVDIEGVMTEIESQAVLIEDLQNSKIDKEADDYYPQLSVGLADNLAGTDYTESEIGFRRSGGGAILDGNARVSSVKGNSVVWNQLSTTTELNQSYSSESLPTGASVIQGHKYAMIFDSVDARLYLYTKIDGTNQIIASSQDGKSLIFTSNSSATSEGSTNAGLWWFTLNKGSVTTYSIKNIRLTDLTLMFEAGNEPATIEEFYARKPKVADENAFNEGEVIHMEADAIKSVGVNQWDEEWEVGTLSSIDGRPITSASAIRVKDFIKVLPSSDYYVTAPTEIQGNIRLYFYDADKNFIGRGFDINNFFAMPSNVHYMKLIVNGTTTYNHDICINLSDTEVNGKYFPYVKREQSLEMLKKYFPNGMRSAGTAHDEIRWNAQKQKWEAIKRIGEVDMGTLNWIRSLATDRYHFNVQIQDILPATIDTYTSNILQSKYPFDKESGTTTQEDKTIRRWSTSIYIRDDAYTDAASFKATMSGVMLYYELAEPIVTEIEENFNLDYEVWNAGTEQMIADTPSTPIKASIAYGFNAVGKIKQLEEIIAQLRAKVGI